MGIRLRIDKRRILRGEMMKVNVGDKIKLPNGKKSFTIQARDDRYIICTQPYNPKHTVIYFIIDLVRQVRGTDNLVFSCGYETKEQCEENLKMLQQEKMEVSYRNVVPLDIDVE